MFVVFLLFYLFAQFKRHGYTTVTSNEYVQERKKHKELIQSLPDPKKYLQVTNKFFLSFES